jgi:hypothetical protein
MLFIILQYAALQFLLKENNSATSIFDQFYHVYGE